MSLVQSTPIRAALALAVMAVAAESSAALVYATEVTAIARGDTSIGNEPGFYGYNGNASAVDSLTEADARTRVLGAPDNLTLALPGGAVAVGDPWPYAYVEVAFGQEFTTADDLVIWEYGYSDIEPATVWLWQAGGGNVQIDIDRPAGSGSQAIVIDLSPYAGIASSFTRMGIGGRNLSGSAQGFDLDAVAVDVAPVPLPGALGLLGAGLAGLLMRGRRAGA